MKKKIKVRNSWVKVMMDRHHGDQRHEPRQKKRQKNAKRNWRSEWEDAQS